MKRLLVLCTFTLVSALGACTSEQPPNSPASSPPGRVDKEAIRRLGEQHAQAVVSKDTARVGDIYAADVVYLPHDDPVEKGLVAARSAWIRGLSVPGLELEYVSDTIEVGAGGDMAYERGRVESTMKCEALPPGNYLYVWRKRDGQWRVVVWIWNVLPPIGRG
jgi:ketosteroid isomerase-like protein